MAKTAAKTSVKSPRKTAATSAKTPATNKPATIKVEQACQDALERLRSLGIDQQLQNDLEWCLGSFRSDNNPVGLFQMAERALTIFREEKSKKTKGVTAKMITDLEKVLEDRE
jgi:hypothetical protein